MSDACDLIESLILHSPPPSTRDACLAWESRWQQFLDSIYGSVSALGSQNSRDALRIIFGGNGLGNDIWNIAYETHFRNLLYLQQHFAREMRSTPGLETRWRALSQRERENCVLEGICQAFDQPGFGTLRMCSPEVTMKYLSSGNGDTFISLVKKVIPSDPDAELKEPLTVTHRFFDLFIVAMRNPAMAKRLKLNKAMALTQVIWKITRVVFGNNEKEVTVKQRRGAMNDVLAGFRDVIGGEASDALAKIINSNRHVQEYACFKCGATESELPHGQKLLRCSRCYKINRTVVYCSRECQATDWSDGFPTAHKSFCGRKVSGDELITV